MTFHKILSHLKQQPLRDVSYWSLRFLTREDEIIRVQRGQTLPPQFQKNSGYMLTVFKKGGIGYAASADSSQTGVAEAFARATKWATWSSQKTVCEFTPQFFIPERGQYLAHDSHKPQKISIRERIDILQHLSHKMAISSEIIDRLANFWFSHVTSQFASSQDSFIEQTFQFTSPQLSATANRGNITEQRSFGGADSKLRQSASDLLEGLHLEHVASQLAHEALALIKSPVCPEQNCDLILLPDQMILQLHESVGHPLELDRILGDERNYAGTSFVTPEMFGKFAYGSKLLNVVFDPTYSSEAASYGFDDEGVRATREYLIKDGLLLRGLGSAISQQRSQLPGVACSRASSWNRPPIDRMANINIEPGHQTLDQLISQVENGILMGTNCSWSIDDSRNKFQFGCEWGKIIKHGKVGHMVRKPNYRGISSQFWHSLKGVGDDSTTEVMGTPFCGKGEPNQAITVGHATPACLFSDISVFGE